MFRCINYMLLILVFLTTEVVCADIVVTDSAGREVRLSHPATRIIALAPHITENIYSAGAGKYLVGVVNHSDYPEQAKDITVVGGFSSFSVERILALKPDLVMAWSSGNDDKRIQQLIQLGIHVYIDEPHVLNDIALSVNNIGVLAATEHIAEPAARQFLLNVEHLHNQYAHKSPVSVLYQVWDSPLQTLNGEHIISNGIEICGGENSYASALSIAPNISIESVIERNPDMIVASGMGEERPEWLDSWKKWTALKAVRQNNLYFIPPDLIQRHTFRMIQGISMMCDFIDRVRQKDGPA